MKRRARQAFGLALIAFGCAVAVAAGHVMTVESGAAR